MAGFTKPTKGVWFILITRPGFVLRNVAYKNHDGILTLLTPEGYMTVYGRGILKLTSPLAATTSLGTWANFTFSQTKQRIYLEKATLIAFAPLAEATSILGSMMMQTALFIALLHDDQEAGKRLYQQMQSFREQLNTPFAAWTTFLIAYLQEQGVPMIVDYCVKCQQTKGIVGVSAHLGGFICKQCLKSTDATALPATHLQALLTRHRHPFDTTISDQVLAGIIPHLHQHFLIHVDVPVPGFAIIETFLTKIHS